MLKRLGGAVLLILGVLACLRIYPHFQNLFGEGRLGNGWDLKVVCHALDAAAAGQDPYLAHLYTQAWSLPYPLLHAYLFQFLCPVGGDPLTYGIVYGALGLISWVLLWPALPIGPWDRIAALVAIFFSFHAFEWELRTGNLAILELPLAGLTVRLLARRKYEWAGGVFGAMASLKILPLFGAMAFLLLPVAFRTRWRSAACAAGGFLALELLNAVLFSRWLPSYLSELADRSPGGPLYEGGGPFNQNSIDFAVAAIRTLNFGYSLPGFALACLGLGVGYLTALACARKTAAHRELPPAAVASLVILVLWIFLFRQKNYAFEAFIPFMLAAGYGIGPWTARCAILASVVVPAAFVSHAVTSVFLAQYYQLLAAWAALLVIFLGVFMASRVDPAGAPAASG